MGVLQKLWRLSRSYGGLRKATSMEGACFRFWNRPRARVGQTLEPQCPRKNCSPVRQQGWCCRGSAYAAMSCEWLNMRRISAVNLVVPTDCELLGQIHFEHKA